MERNKLTLGSLFDGSGGFPLGGLLSGITPVWASEIEPFPIRVTTKRLPFMKHYGDVSRMDGGKIEPVDIITFGSPCQDMSIAGRREGLDGSRSSLFYEAVRIVKEMRCATDGRYPRYIVWENVPGAFSSNKGADFQSVLEEICSVKGYEIHTPRPEKWTTAGEIVADNFSLAWRVFDAQYWGVPQRRKRIYLVADFAGESAGKILFKSEGVSGYTPQGFRSWQGAAGTSEKGAGAAGCVCLNDQGGNRMDVTDGVTCTLRAGTVPAPVSSSGGGDEEETGFPVEVALDATDRHAVAYGIDRATYNMGRNAKFGITVETEIAPTMVSKGPGAVGQPIYHSSKSSFPTNFTDDDVTETLVATDFKDSPTVSKEPDYIVRRLTPTECARLQGFPGWWCDALGTDEPTENEIEFWTEVFEIHRRVMGTSSKPKSRNQIIKWLKDPHSDFAEYKMWGNGVALPNVCFVLSGIVYYAQLSGE